MKTADPELPVMLQVTAVLVRGYRLCCEQDHVQGGYVPVPQLLLHNSHLLYTPEHLSLHLLAILGQVAQADARDVAHILGGELELVETSPT